RADAVHHRRARVGLEGVLLDPGEQGSQVQARGVLEVPRIVRGHVDAGGAQGAHVRQRDAEVRDLVVARRTLDRAAELAVDVQALEAGVEGADGAAGQALDGVVDLDVVVVDGDVERRQRLGRQHEAEGQRVGLFRLQVRIRDQQAGDRRAVLLVYADLVGRDALGDAQVADRAGRVRRGRTGLDD